MDRIRIVGARFLVSSGIWQHPRIPRQIQNSRARANGKMGSRYLATKLSKDGQQPVLLLPARWWPDTLPEFESGGWWQRPHTRVRCRQCKCSLVENPSFRSRKCHGCEKQMKTIDKRLDGIVFTNADPRYAGKLMIRKEVTRQC